MRPDERERFLEKVLDVLSDPRAAMSEGRPHKKAKTRALDMLGLHFGALGRVVYLAEEMAVLYPGKEVFTPDVLAVLDVPQPEDDERMAWVVADEGKGLDLVLEVLHHGDRNKDLVENVERYADLGIPEYFVYDRAQQRIRGHRLPEPGAKRYAPILAQGGRYHSAVLGLDLAVEGGTLRFFHGMSELFGSGDLIRRLTGMVQDSEAKADQAAMEAVRSAADAVQAKAGLRAGILAALDTRGLSVSGALRERIASCEDPATLQRWLLRALSASRAEDAIDPAPPS
jgi:Uma2 family endonuclease